LQWSARKPVNNLVELNILLADEVSNELKMVALFCFCLLVLNLELDTELFPFLYHLTEFKRLYILIWIYIPIDFLHQLIDKYKEDI
jgi:hypothetical protein